MKSALPVRRFWQLTKTVSCVLPVTILASGTCHAQQVGDPFTLHDTGSCPAFHCDAEGTGVQPHALPFPLQGKSLTSTPLLPTACGGRGQPDCQMPGFQSCSSDDAHALCLFTQGPDAVIAFDVTDPASPHHFVLASDPTPGDPASSMTAPVQDEKSDAAVVPLVGQDQSLILADGNWTKRLRADGSQVWPTSLSPPGVGDVGAQLGYETSLKHLRAVAGLTRSNTRARPPLR